MSDNIDLQFKVAPSFMSELATPYSNIPAALSELIANAWDANASKVEIWFNIHQDEIIIADNGDGMSIQDIDEKYLLVGRKKRNTPDIFMVNNRHVMGRKGLGKLAAFTFGNEVELQSSHNGQRDGLIINWQEQSKSTAESPYRFPRLSESQLIVSRGTQITIRQLHKEKLLPLENILRKTLARRFSILDGKHNFQVIFNGEAISSKDRPFYEKVEFIWYLGDESKEFVNNCPNVKRTIRLDNIVNVEGEPFKVRGWVATVVKPSDIKESEKNGDVIIQNNTIALFAHGKLIQENILADFQMAGVYEDYIIGDIDADFLDADDKADIITPDRQRIMQNNTRYEAIKTFVGGIRALIGRTWSLYRKEREVDDILQVPTIEIWYSTLNKADKERVILIFTHLKSLPFYSEQDKIALCEMVTFVFDGLKKDKEYFKESIDSDKLVRHIKQLYQQFQPKKVPQPTKHETAKSDSPPSPKDETTNRNSSEPPTGETPKPDSQEPTAGETSKSDSSEPQTSENPNSDSLETPTSENPNSDSSEPTTGETPKSDSLEPTTGKTPNPDSPEPTTGETPNPDSQEPTTGETSNPDSPEPPIGETPRSDSPETDVPPRVLPLQPEKEVDTLFQEIKTAINNSDIEQSFKNMALYDLEQAQISYYCQAHKACVVMLGSVIEGLMLGVLRRPNALSCLKNDINLPKQIGRKLNGGIGNPIYVDDKVFADALGDDLSFEDYKLLMNHYIASIKGQGIEDIQRFRNAVHPWIAIRALNYDAAIAIRNISILKTLAYEILAWKP